MTTMLEGQGRLAWPDGHAVRLVVCTPASAPPALAATLSHLLDRFGQGVLVSANRPWHLLRQRLEAAGLSTGRLLVVDCATSAVGPRATDPAVLPVESPALLEKIALRAEQALRRLGGRGFLVLDSLSALALYSGPPAVAEMAHALVNRLRLQQVPAALFLVDEPARGDLLDLVRPLCDGVLRL